MDMETARDRLAYQWMIGKSAFIDTGDKKSYLSPLLYISTGHQLTNSFRPSSQFFNQSPDILFPRCLEHHAWIAFPAQFT
jgi:hypothetical protein